MLFGLLEITKMVILFVPFCHIYCVLSHEGNGEELFEIEAVWKLSNLLMIIMQEMGLWTLLEGFLLLANALAIINEDRFLAPRGWSFSEFSVGRTKSLKGQIIGLIYATQYMRVPLILLNAICIVVKLVSGWCFSR